MAYNLFIAYDLVSPGQNYDTVREAIRRLGQWYQFQYSLFYVHTELSANAAHDRVRAVMDANDRLVVIDATTAVASVYPQPHFDAINAVWFTA